MIEQPFHYHQDNIPEKNEETLSIEDTFAAYINFGNDYFAKLIKLLGIDRKFTTANGQYIYDDRGNKYYDLLGGYGSLNLGHNHPRIIKRLQSILTAPNILPIRLSQYQAELMSLLFEITGKRLQRVYLANSGAETTEAAIKLVVAATGKPHVLYAERAFHGKTIGALAVTGNPKYQNPFRSLLAKHPSVPYDDINALEQTLSTRQDLAGFIIEPIQGEGGIRIPKPDYLSTARELCTRYKVPFIIDEIQTGLGRTGKMFASMEANPDVLLVGKSLSGGLVPIGAFVTSDDIWHQAYGSYETCLLHTSTFSGNTLACALASETIRILLEENLVENAAQVGAYFLRLLQDIAPKHRLIKEVRGTGLLIGVELQPPFLGNSFTKNYLAQIVAAKLFRTDNIITAFSLNNPLVIRFEPPLQFTKADADHVVSAFDRLLTSLPKPDQHVTTLISSVDCDIRFPVECHTIIGGEYQRINKETASSVFNADAMQRDLSLIPLLNKPYGQLASMLKSQVASIYHPVTTETNQNALQACENAKNDFFHTPISKRNAILHRWREQILENFPTLVQLGTKDGYNYKTAVWQIDTLLNILQPERIECYQNMLSPHYAFDSNAAVFYRRRQPGIVGIAPAANAAIVLGSLGITAAISAGQAFVICGGRSATNYLLLTYLCQAFDAEHVSPHAVNAVWGVGRHPVFEWAEFVTLNGRVTKLEQSDRLAPSAKPTISRLCYWGPRNMDLVATFERRGIKGTYDFNGSDPVIVDKTADLDLAIKDVLLRYEASGQVCISPKRAIVHKDISEKFLSVLNEEVRALRVGLLSDPLNDLMPVAGRYDRQRYQDAIKEAIESESDVFLWGKKVKDDWESTKKCLFVDWKGEPNSFGAYPVPAIVHVKPGKSLMAAREEMFNPLLAFMEFSNTDQAIRIANDSCWGIRASVWSNDKEFIDRCCIEIDSASVLLNTPHMWLDLGTSDLGGSKSSGINFGYPGAKFLVNEFSDDFFFRRFHDAAEAQRFVNSYCCTL